MWQVCVERTGTGQERNQKLLCSFHLVFKPSSLVSLPSYLLICIPLPVCLIYLSVLLSLYLLTYLPTHLPVYLTIYLFIHQSFQKSIHPFIHLNQPLCLYTASRRTIIYIFKHSKSSILLLQGNGRQQEQEPVTLRRPSRGQVGPQRNHALLESILLWDPEPLFTRSTFFSRHLWSPLRLHTSSNLFLENYREDTIENLIKEQLCPGNEGQRTVENGKYK